MLQSILRSVKTIKVSKEKKQVNKKLKEKKD